MATKRRDKEERIDKTENGDDITAYIGTTWARLAKDRKTWKDHEQMRSAIFNIGSTQPIEIEIEIETQLW